MSNTVFKLMMFSIVLNFAVGIMTVAIPVFDITNTGGLPGYDANYTDDFTGDMDDKVTPASVAEDKNDQLSRVMDVLTLGFVSRFLETVDKYMFGFVLVLKGVFSPFMEPAISNLLFGILRTLIGIGYIIGAWVLWTGRDITS